MLEGGRFVVKIFSMYLSYMFCSALLMPGILPYKFLVSTYSYAWMSLSLTLLSCSVIKESYYFWTLASLIYLLRDSEYICCLFLFCSLANSSLCCSWRTLFFTCSAYFYSSNSFILLLMSFSSIWWFNPNLLKFFVFNLFLASSSSFLA